MPSATRSLALAAGLALTAALLGCAETSQVRLEGAAARGEDVAREKGCAGCHGGLNAEASVGPSWEGSWGRQITLDDGTTATFDETFVRTAVRDPDAQRREGDWLHMPAFGPEQVSDAELDDLIEYLRALGDA